MSRFVPVLSLLSSLPALALEEEGPGVVQAGGAASTGSFALLSAEQGMALRAALPSVLFTRTLGGLELWQWVGLALVLVCGWLAGRALEGVVLRMAVRATGLTRSGWDDQLVSSGRGPLRHVLSAVLVASGALALRLPQPARHAVELGARSVVIATVAWFLLRFVKVASRFVEQTVARESSGADVARARGLRTQLAVLRRVAEVVVVLVAASLLLLQFEAVRNVGVSLLASAGLAGLVIGLAAQKSISTLLAGIQLSITQPIRIGDTVIVENEFGTVEQITLTYVVLRTWDQRRMVLPITQFMDKPFQNWSKGSPEMLGAVILQVDYFADIDALRAELKRILEGEGKEMWDGRVGSVVVLEVMDRTLTVRALVSVANSEKLFDLRALVRERLVQFLRANPQWLPITRTESRTAPTPPAPPPPDNPTPAAPPLTPRA